MARTVFTPFDGTVDADWLNKIDTTVVDVLGEPATAAEARAHLGASEVGHAHAVATQSINGNGGSPGFISAQSLEKFTKATSFPAAIQAQVPAGAVFMLMSQDGQVQGITLTSLIDIFGSGGGEPHEGNFGGEIGGDGQPASGVGIFGGEIGGDAAPGYGLSYGGEIA